jgi:hypothetical protein
VVTVYAVALGLSAGAVFFNPAAQSVLPAIVRERELVAANSGLCRPGRPPPSGGTGAGSTGRRPIMIVPP